LPHLWPTGSSSGWPPSITARYFSSCPSDSTSRWTPCPPEPTRIGFRSALVCIRLSPSCPFRLLHTCFLFRPTRHYPRFWIQRSSSERRRDFNPPEQRAAQRTLRPLLTSRLLSRWIAPAVVRCVRTRAEISSGNTCLLLPRPPDLPCWPLSDDWASPSLAGLPRQRWPHIRFLYVEREISSSTFFRFPLARDTLV
jgi:hypothetical protein